MKLEYTKAREGVPGSEDRYTVAFERGSLSVGLYEPRGADHQTPHARDELYVVVRGTGTYRCGGSSWSFAPGDVLFAPAAVEHRFADFSDDLSVWVMFYGPQGGERPGSSRLFGIETAGSAVDG